MPHEDYDKRIRKVEKEQANSSSIKGIPIGKVLRQNFENLLYLQHEVKHLLINKLAFAKYTETDEIYRRMINIKLLDVASWEKLNDLL